MRKVKRILADTTELKKLIKEHPSYPIAEEEYQKRLSEEIKKYEPYWKDCIFIYADN